MDKCECKDIAMLLNIVKSLLMYLPCNVQRGPEWMNAWESLSEDDKNSIIEEAAIAHDIATEINIKYNIGGKYAK